MMIRLFNSFRARIQCQLQHIRSRSLTIVQFCLNKERVSNTCLEGIYGV